MEELTLIVVVAIVVVVAMCNLSSIKLDVLKFQEIINNKMKLVVIKVASAMKFVIFSFHQAGVRMYKSY